jgi:hypothetical protein
MRLWLTLLLEERMKKNDLYRPIQPKEAQLLVSTACLPVGTIITMTGTFSKFAMGTWSGSHVQIAGLMLLVMAAYGMALYLYALRSRLKANLLLLIVFVVILGAAIYLPIKLVNVDRPFRPIYFAVLPLVPAHFLHKVLIKDDDENKS